MDFEIVTSTLKCIYNMDHIRIAGTKPSSVIIAQTK